MLAERELLPEVKKVHLDKCLDFFSDKQNRVVFRPRPLMRRKNTLELPHTDDFYVDAKLHANAQYFVSFIDDYRQKLWASMLKTKDQMLSILKEF